MKGRIAIPVVVVALLGLLEAGAAGGFASRAPDGHVCHGVVNYGSARAEHILAIRMRCSSVKDAIRREAPAAEFVCLRFGPDDRKIGCTKRSDTRRGFRFRIVGG